MSKATNLDISSPIFKSNPYTTFGQLRTESPVSQIRLPDGRPAWIITRYAEVEMVLRDQRFQLKITNALAPEELGPHAALLKVLGSGSELSFLGSGLLASDPPEHTRLRALVNLSFTPRLIEQWRERIQAITDELLDAVEPRGEMDLIESFAFPLPITVITEMLGVPLSDRAQFRQWSDQLITASSNPIALANLSETARGFKAYLLKLIEDKRAHSAEDLLTKLLLAEEAGDQLSSEELIALVALLLVAGHETTVNLIGNGMLNLLKHPGQLALLKQNPDLIKTAIEELLRYQGPLMTATPRWASENVELAGQEIPRGSMVLVVLASANRDELQFANAAGLDLTRQENHHLAFGKGIHYCLGAPLARLEGQIALSTLLRRLPNLHLAIDPQDLSWRPGMLMLGLNTLPVSF